VSAQDDQPFIVLGGAVRWWRRVLNCTDFITDTKERSSVVWLTWQSVAYCMHC